MIIIKEMIKVATSIEIMRKEKKEKKGEEE